MSSVNVLNPRVDQTVRIYDNFYRFEVVVDANTWDEVYSYFRSVYSDNEIANNFATSLFRIAKETNTPVLTLLQSIQGQNSVELTATVCYYLNGLRSPSTLLGVNGRVTPNIWAARNVLS
jgi:hypothetical protein